MDKRGVFFPVKIKSARDTRFEPFWRFFLGHLFAIHARKLSIFRLFSRPLFFTGTCLIFFSQVENFVSRALI